MNRHLAASLAVAALALGMTMPTASGLLVPASCCAQRIASGEAATVRSAVLLSAITARADEHLTSASGIAHRSSRVGCGSFHPASWISAANVPRVMASAGPSMPLRLGRKLVRKNPHYMRKSLL